MTPRDLVGHDVYDRDGTPLGQVVAVHGSTATRTPEWVTVGDPEVFVPLARATSGEAALRVAATVDQVAAAPRVPGPMTDDAAAALCAHYGLPAAPPAVPLQRPKPSDMPRRRAV